MHKDNLAILFIIPDPRRPYNLESATLIKPRVVDVRGEEVCSVGFAIRLQVQFSHAVSYAYLL